jgi:hypothetical protein
MVVASSSSQIANQTQRYHDVGKIFPNVAHDARLGYMLLTYEGVRQPRRENVQLCNAQISKFLADLARITAIELSDITKMEVRVGQQDELEIHVYIKESKMRKFLHFSQPCTTLYSKSRMVIKRTYLKEGFEELDPAHSGMFNSQNSGYRGGRIHGVDYSCYA